MTARHLWARIGWATLLLVGLWYVVAPVPRPREGKATPESGLSGHIAFLNAPPPSPWEWDGPWYDLLVADLATGRCADVDGAPLRLQRVAPLWYPGGKQMLVMGNDPEWGAEAALVQVPPDPSYTIPHTAAKGLLPVRVSWWEPGRSVVASPAGSLAVWVIECARPGTRSEPPVPVLPRTPGVGEAVLAPEGERVALVLDDQLHIMPRDAVDSGESLGQASDLAWSPDGRTLACARRTMPDAPGGIALYDTEHCSWRQLTTTLAAGESYETPTWSPDGRALAYCRVRGGGGSIWIDRLDGAAPRRLPTKGSAVCPSWGE